MKIKKFEIEEDGNVKKLKIKKDDGNSHELDIENFEEDNKPPINNEKRTPHALKTRTIIDPDGHEQNLVFAYCTGSRWIYINGRWYKIG